MKGIKIGGNAQRRLKNIIFQHGSIPLKNRAEEGGAFMREKPLNLLEQTSSLAESGLGEGESELKSLLAESFREEMGVELQEDRLTTQEETKSVKLLRKYRDDGWNLRGEHQ